MLITFFCAQCNKQFVSSVPTRKYCSRYCYGQSLRTAQQICCSYCGKIFDVPPNVLSIGKGKYCSVKCYQVDHAPIVKICKHCKKSFSVPQHMIHKGIGKYCSKECYHASTRRKKIVLHCNFCDRPFSIYPSRTNTAKFCSTKCSYAYHSISSEKRRISQRQYRALLPANWEEIKQKVQTRDIHICTRCKSFHPNLNVHHIIPLRLSHTSKMSNLRTLCPPCHMWLENQFQWLL